MRVVEALLLILALLYIAASIYYVFMDYMGRQGSPGESLPNLSNLPKNISGQDLYLTYNVKGYLILDGGIVSIDRAQLSLDARYVEVPPEISDSTANQTSTNTTSEERYYSVTARGDPAVIVAIRSLIMLAYNISDPDFSISQGWRANSPGEIFGNLSLFKQTGSGEMAGRGSTSIKYTEYTYQRDGDRVVVWLERDTGIPLLCRINTSWANLELRLAYASS